MMNKSVATALLLSVLSVVGCSGQKKEAAARKNQKIILSKELKIRPNEYCTSASSSIKSSLCIASRRLAAPHPTTIPAGKQGKGAAAKDNEANAGLQTGGTGASDL